MKIEYCKSYQIIFSYGFLFVVIPFILGSIGKKFYVLLSGKVYILIPQGFSKPNNLSETEF